MLDGTERKDKCSFSLLNNVIQRHLDFNLKIDVKIPK